MFIVIVLKEWRFEGTNKKDESDWSDVYRYENRSMDDRSHIWTKISPREEHYSPRHKTSVNIIV